MGLVLATVALFAGCGADDGPGSQIGVSGGTGARSGTGGSSGSISVGGFGGSGGTGNNPATGGTGGVAANGGSGGSGGTGAVDPDGGGAAGAAGAAGDDGGEPPPPPVPCTTNAECDDGLWCTGVEICYIGFCAAGLPPISCPSDGKSCTQEVCVEATRACTSIKQDSACSDGTFCNGVERCDPTAAGANATTGCVPGVAINCNDGYSCTDDSCDETANSCRNALNDARCSDNVFCNGDELCDPTVGDPSTGCRAATRGCDDGFSCTDDTCDETNDTCTHTPVHARCQNGSFCDGQETCSPGPGAPTTGCRIGTAVSCASDGQACTIEGCDESKSSFNPQVACVSTFDSSQCAVGEYCTATGCILAPACSTEAECNDGNDCNGIETCDLSIGRCRVGAPKNCNDNVSCTADSCQAPGVCVNTPQDSLCNDGNRCNGTEVCDGLSDCTFGIPLDCDDGIACTRDDCDPIAGCKPVPQDGACADTSACNGNETCDVALGCRPGTTLTCPSDGIACTRDACSDALGGCAHIPDNSLCGSCGQTCSPTQGGCGNFCTPATCQGKTYQCGDCLDNDGDCLIDAADSACLGACQNNETGFFGDIPGQNNAPCKADCYFDQDTGSGNDDCYWSHECDPLSVAPNYYPEGSKCTYSPTAGIPGTSQGCAQLMNTQSATCLSYCGPLTPNGCDCFGCCEMPGAPTTVWLGSVDSSGEGTCDLASRANPSLCKPCTQVTACANTCAHCELCVGKTELPPDCTEQQCPSGVQRCGLPGQLPCPAGFFCVTGCCQRTAGG
jgi:hypothetical protein